MDIFDEKELEKLKRERKKAEKKDNLKEVAQICNCIGELLAKYGRWEEAKAEHENELSISEAFEDTIGSAVACRKIGECFCGMEQYDKALQFQQRHLQLSRSCGSLLEEQRALATIGRTYLFQCEGARGKQNTLKASKHAEEAFCKSLTVCENLKEEVKNVEYMEMKARLYLNLGLVYDGRGDTRQCAEYMKKAITLSEQHQLHSDLYRCQYSLATMYQRNNNFSQALRYLESALKSAIKLKDKYLESDVYVQKALVCVQVGDVPTSKHSLKKAHKLGAPTKEESERTVKYFKAVCKIEEALTSLENLQPDSLSARLKLYEQLGDGAADIGNFRQALDFYHKMLDNAVTQHLPVKDLIPIYVSLAQTYADNKQYEKAVEYYKKEKECRGEDYEQICRTWLNIAECRELDGSSYDDVSKCYIKAHECAKKASHAKLQVHVLKSLIEVQKYYKQKTHQKQTEGKLQNIKSKFKVNSDDELSEEGDSQKSDELDNLSISELSESDESEEEGSRPKTLSRRTTKARATRNEKGETPLHRACIEGNLKKVQKLVEQGHPLSPRDHCGWIPLHEAANHDYYDIVAYLLEHGAAINDRGGQHCGGVTPLIDSGNCGNMEIIDLLIEKGANVLAKDDEGNTALDCLRAWKERCDHLDDEVLKKFYDTEKRLASLMGGKCSTSNLQKSQTRRDKASQRSQQIVEECDLPHLSLPERVKKRKSNTGHSRDLRRRMSSSDTDENDSRTSEVTKSRTPDLSDSEEFFPNPVLDNHVDISQSATDTYKLAIDSLRGHINRKTSASQNYHQSRSTQQTSAALVDAEEFIDDDWLIDDMQQPTKRQKLDINGVFSSNSSRKFSSENASRIYSTQNENTSRKSSSSSVKKNRSVIIDDDSSNDEITGCHDNSSQGNEDILMENDEMNTITQNDFLPKRPSQKSKPRQLSLNNFAVRLSETGNSAEETITGDQTLIGSFSTQNVVRSQSTQRETAGPVMRVKVRVKDKLLLIPIPSSETEKTIAWLCQETSQRYYSMCGLRPLLTLSTKDGAFLSASDQIFQVLSSNEEVDGIVDSWDLPPLVERYQQACKALNIVCYRNIKTILQTCDSTSKLVITDLGLRPVQCQSIFRALQCQNTLKELNLPGNRMGDTGLESFLKVCTTLPNLTLLNFRCNEITGVGLKTMADFLQDCDNPVLKMSKHKRMSKRKGKRAPAKEEAKQDGKKSAAPTGPAGKNSSMAQKSQGKHDGKQASAMERPESHQTEKSDSNVDEGKKKMVWAHLQGVAVEWPCRLDKHFNKKNWVYCHSDDILLASKKIIPFNDVNREKLKEKALTVFRKKPNMLKSWFDDLKWAEKAENVEEEDSEGQNNEVGDNDKETAQTDEMEEEDSEGQNNEVGDNDKETAQTDEMEEEDSEGQNNEVGDNDEETAQTDEMEEEDSEGQINEVGDIDEETAQNDQMEEEDSEGQNNEVGDNDKETAQTDEMEEEDSEGQNNEVGDNDEETAQTDEMEEEDSEGQINEDGDIDEEIALNDQIEEEDSEGQNNEVGDNDKETAQTDEMEEEDSEGQNNEVGDNDKETAQTDEMEEEDSEGQNNEVGDNDEETAQTDEMEEEDSEGQINEVGDIDEETAQNDQIEEEDSEGQNNEVGDNDKETAQTDEIEEEDSEGQNNEVGDIDEETAQTDQMEEEDSEGQNNEVGDIDEETAQTDEIEEEDSEGQNNEVGDIDEETAQTDQMEEEDSEGQINEVGDIDEETAQTDEISSVISDKNKRRKLLKDLYSRACKRRKGSCQEEIIEGTLHSEEEAESEHFSEDDEDSKWSDSECDDHSESEYLPEEDEDSDCDDPNKESKCFPEEEDVDSDYDDPNKESKIFPEKEDEDSDCDDPNKESKRFPEEEDEDSDCDDPNKESKRFSEEEDENSKINDSEFTEKDVSCCHKALSDDVIIRDKKNSKIYIRKSQKSKLSITGREKKNDRVWNNYHCCFICKKLISNITKHLLTHKDHKKSEELNTLKEKVKVVKKKQKNGLLKTIRCKQALLRNRGDHEHNLNVRAMGNGELIIGRKPNKKAFNQEDYNPCPDCLEWIKLDFVSKHQEVCAGKNDQVKKKKKGEVIVLSEIISDKINCNASKRLLKEVLPIMTRDSITQVAKEDDHIIGLGNQWLLRNLDNKLKRKYYTSSRMRGAARLLIHLRNLTETNYAMKDYLKPEYFDQFCQAALLCASIENDDEEDLKSPSTALKLGYDIRRLVGIKYGIALRKQDHTMKNEAEDFYKLLNLDWTLRVSKLAHMALRNLKMNKDQKALPIPSDLSKLSAAVVAELKSIELNSTYKCYRRTVMLLSTRLLTYNKRRSGELQGMSLTNYKLRSKGLDDADQALFSRELTDLEKHLATSQEMIKIRGKNGKIVPVLIPEECVRPLEHITAPDVRKAVGIKDWNGYVFANRGGDVIRAYDSLKTLCGEFCLTAPERITSVSMRKYIATLTQVIDMKEHEIEWLCQHLGHTATVHKLHYRSTSGFIERVNIGKLMLLQDLNLAGRYSGQRLQDIDFSAVLDERKESQEKLEENTISSEGSQGEPINSEGRQVEPSNGNLFCGIPDDFQLEGQPSKSKPKHTRQMWSKEEENEIHSLFERNFDENFYPGLKDCNEAIKKSRKNNGHIHRRSWETLKKKVIRMMKSTK